ncbi:hypothetical protein C8Q73DRAFT_210624 [Cubamyces lactineus]|nr:hypothetical protein C8Q73DRAFT_210624 [Cubamyces lactineus]
MIREGTTASAHAQVPRPKARQPAREPRSAETAETAETYQREPLDDFPRVAIDGVLPEWSLSPRTSRH